MLEMPAQEQRQDTTQPESGGVDVRAERAAQHIGHEVGEVERLPFDLSVLLEEGVFLVRRITCG